MLFLIPAFSVTVSPHCHISKSNRLFHSWVSTASPLPLHLMPEGRGLPEEELVFRGAYIGADIGCRHGADIGCSRTENEAECKKKKIKKLGKVYC